MVDLEGQRTDPRGDRYRPGGVPGREAPAFVRYPLMSTTTLTVRPKTLDFSLYGGDSFAVQFIFTDSETGEPWPLTGTWQAQIRNKGEELTEFSIDEVDAGEGKLYLGLTGEQTADLVGLQTLDWDLQQDYPGGPRTWYRGAVNVTGDITRV